MANSKISALTSATTPLAGTEVLPVVQSSTTKQVSVANLTAGRAVSAASLALTTPLSASNGGTGLSALGTGVATWLGTPSSANLAAAVTDETGSGALVFGTNPTFSNTGGNPSANFTNSIYQDVNVNYYGAAGTVGAKINLNFGDNGSTSSIGSFTIYGSAYGGGLNNAMEFGNSSGKFRVTTAGDGLLTTGNLVQGTAAKGINFTANTPASGMTSQLLNWYEEGTWTPANSSGSATFTTNFARYTRIGRVVHIQLSISINTNSDSASLGISGLPYTCATNGWAPSIINTNAAQTALMRVASGSTALNAYTVSAETGIPWSAFSGKYIITQITYSI